MRIAYEEGMAYGVFAVFVIIACILVLSGGCCFRLVPM